MARQLNVLHYPEGVIEGVTHSKTIEQALSARGVEASVDAFARDPAELERIARARAADKVVSFGVGRLLREARGTLDGSETARTRLDFSKKRGRKLVTISASDSWEADSVLAGLKLALGRLPPAIVLLSRWNLRDRARLRNYWGKNVFIDGHNEEGIGKLFEMIDAITKHVRRQQ